MLTTEENDYNTILLSVHHEDFTANDLNVFYNKYKDIKLNKLRYTKTGDSIIHVCARLGRTDLLSYMFNNWGLINVDIKNNDSKTPLHEASQFAQFEVVQLLIAFNAQVNAIKRADWTPLMLACTKTGEDASKIVKLLVQEGTILNLQNKDGWTALHIACREGDRNIIDNLINASEDNLNLKTSNGRTLLHISALHGHLDIVKTLLKYIDPNETDNSGNNVLHEATFSENIEIIELLLCNGCDINSVNNIGFSCLHLAASQGLDQLVRYYIIQQKMDVNMKSVQSLTALHCAARKKHSDTIKILTELGADTNETDSHGRIPNDYFIL